MQCQTLQISGSGVRHVFTRKLEESVHCICVQCEWCCSMTTRENHRNHGPFNAFLHDVSVFKRCSAPAAPSTNEKMRYNPVSVIQKYPPPAATTRSADDGVNGNGISLPPVSAALRHITCGICGFAIQTSDPYNKAEFEIKICPVWFVEIKLCPGINTTNGYLSSACFLPSPPPIQTATTRRGM